MILVSILGDFHSSILPICYEFREDISRHVILYDDSGKDTNESWRILRGQKAFLEMLPQESPSKYELISMQIDENNYESIIDRFEEISIMAQEKGDDIYLNSTDGLSSIAVVLSSKFLETGGKVIAYDRFSNTYNLHTFDSMQKYQMRDKMDILTHIALKGYSVENMPSKKDLEERRPVVMRLCRSVSSYMRFLKDIKSSKRVVTYSKRYNSYKQKLEDIGKSDDYSFLTKGVFNEYIYHLLRENFNFDDVLTTVNVKADENVETQLDIIMLKDNHLHVMECDITLHSIGTKQIYRMETILDYLDDDAKAMVLSIKREGKQFNNGDRARASYGGIKIHKEKNFRRQDFFDDVEQWFL